MRFLNSFVLRARRAVYVGSRHIVKDVGHPDYVPLFIDDEFDENGEPNYIDVDGGRVG